MALLGISYAPRFAIWHPKLYIYLRFVTNNHFFKGRTSWFLYPAITGASPHMKNHSVAAPELSRPTPAILDRCDMGKHGETQQQDSHLLVCSAEDDEAFSSMSSQGITCEALNQSVNALKYHFTGNLMGSFTVLRQCSVGDAPTLCWRWGLGVQSFLLSVEALLGQAGEGPRAVLAQLYMPPKKQAHPPAGPPKRSSRWW